MKKQILALFFAIAAGQTAFAQNRLAPPETSQAPAANFLARAAEVCAAPQIKLAAADKDVAKTAAPSIESPAETIFDSQKAELKSLIAANEKIVRSEPKNARPRANAAQDEIDFYWKNEFFAGYSFTRTDTSYGSDDFADDNFDPSFNGSARNALNSNAGFNAAFVRNFNYLLGIKVDVSAHRRRGDVLSAALPAALAGNQSYTLVNVLAGVQIKDNRKETNARLKPFGHFMLGAGHQKFSFSNGLEQQFAANGLKTSGTQIALAVGGGVDVKISRRVDLRLFQFDYIPLFEKDPPQPDPVFEEDRIVGRVQNNFRISIGLVFH